MKSFLKRISVLLFMLVLITGVQAAEWQSLKGPPGSCVGVRGIVVNPINNEIVYAGTWGAGMFKTFDGGIEWIAKNNGLSGHPRPEYIDELVIDPNNPDILYLGNHTFECVWKSTDGGETWLARGQGLVRTSDVHLAIHPINSNIIVAAFDAIPSSSAKAYISFDGADTWNVILEGHGTRSVAIASDTEHITIYLGGSWGQGLKKTIDAGTTWVSRPIPNFSSIPDIVIDPSNENVLYATSDNSGQVAKSFDGGDSLFLASDGLPGNNAYDLAINPDNPQEVYVVDLQEGVYKTTDGGENWFAANSGLPLPGVGFVTIDTKNTRILYAADWGVDGIYKTTDGGQSWAEINKGLANTDVVAIAVGRSPEEVIYAGANFVGCFRTTDKGENWQLIHQEGFRVLTIHPETSTTVFGGGSYTEGSLYKSEDMGDHWEILYTPPVWKKIEDFVINPLNPEIIYAGYGSYELDSGLVKSTDGGKTWQEKAQGMNCGMGHAVVICIHPTGTDTLFAAAAKSFLYRSNDAGEKWEEVEHNNFLENVYIKDMVFNPSNPQILYLVGIDESQNPSGDGIIFRSGDGGKTWQNVTNNIPSFLLHFSSVTVSNQQEIFVGTYGKGVYKSTNGGQYWTEFNEGFLNDRIRTLTISEEQETELYAGLAGAGVFYRSLPTGTPEKVINKPTTNLLRIYPNPFHTTATIYYSCSSLTKVSLKVYDSSGRLIKVLVDDLKNPGNYTVDLFSKKMANGIYFAEMIIGNDRVTKKMIILK